MENYDIFKSFTDSFFDSITIIEDNSECKRYTKKRKIDEISYMTDEKDLINENMDEDIDDDFDEEYYLYINNKMCRTFI